MPELDVPPAVLREEVEQEVAVAPCSAFVLVGRAVGEVAAAQRRREAVVEVGREAAVHQERRRERDGVAVVEAGVHPAEVVVGVEPSVDLVAGLEVDAPAPARRPLGLDGAGVAGEDQLAVEVEEPDRRREVEAVELARARAELVAERLRERRGLAPRRHAGAGLGVPVNVAGDVARASFE